MLASMSPKQMYQFSFGLLDDAGLFALDGSSEVEPVNACSKQLKLELLRTEVSMLLGKLQGSGFGDHWLLPSREQLATDYRWQSWSGRGNEPESDSGLC